MDGLGGSLSHRVYAVKKNKKSEHKWKKDMKTLKKHNEMLYIISKKSGSHRELNKINNIRANSSKNSSYFISNSLSSDSEYSLSSDIK